VTVDAVDAEISWFNASKGFGFVKLSDGTEAYLHIRVLKAAESRAVFKLPPFVAVYTREPSGVRQRSVGGDALRKNAPTASGR
jgi:CspA family cold shock protein